VDAFFCNPFHRGDHDKVPQALELMTAAYLDNPSDALTAVHVSAGRTVQCA